MHWYESEQAFPSPTVSFVKGKLKLCQWPWGKGQERRDEVKNESDVGRRWKDERILERAPHLQWDMKNIKRWEKAARGGDRMSACSWGGRSVVENNRACPLRRSVNLNATACLGLCRPSYTCADRVCQSSTSPYAPSFSRAFVHETEKGGTPSRWECACDLPAKSCCQRLRGKFPTIILILHLTSTTWAYGWFLLENWSTSTEY